MISITEIGETEEQGLWSVPVAKTRDPHALWGERYGAIELGPYEIEAWVVRCECGTDFYDRLRTVAMSEWRNHAGVSERRTINDANVLSK